MRYETRLEELAALQDGWYNGDGLSIDPKAIEGARDVLTLLYANYHEVEVYIYPTPEGHIQLELNHGDWDVDIQCTNSFYELLAVALYSDETIETSVSDVEAVLDFIKTLEEK